MDRFDAAFIVCVGPNDNSTKHSTLESYKPNQFLHQIPKAISLEPVCSKFQIPIVLRKNNQEKRKEQYLLLSGQI